MGYTKETYSQARRTLDDRRERARQTSETRKIALYEKIPRLLQIEQELAETGLAAARTAITKGANIEPLIASLEQKNRALQQERAALLKQQELPADYLAISYTCPACQDTGYIGQQRCDCMKQLLRQIAYRQISEAGDLHDCRFSSFLLDYYPEQSSDERAAPRAAMRRILSFCEDYAAHFSPTSESLLFFGNTGLGKTHLSIAIAHTVIDRGFGVYYTSCQRLTDKLHAVQFGRAGSDETDYQQLATDCDLLILDDLGAEFSTSFTIAALQSIINTRLSEGRPTIISTNLDVSLLSERYSERLASRLFCAYRSLPFYGEDIRLLKRYAQ